MEKQMELALENSRYNILRLNQYSKGFYIKLHLINYEYKSSDVATIEFMINGIAIIQSTDVTIEDDTVIFKLLREVTLNSGKGYFNVVISNSNDNSRTSNFKADIEIIGNSIDENTVSATLVTTAKEELDNSVATATTTLEELNAAIESSSIANKVDKVDGKGLSTNDFTDYYRDTVNNNASNIAVLQSTVNNVTYGNEDAPTAFTLVCGTTEATKYNDANTHNWYIVRNGFCFIQLDLNIINKDIRSVAIINNLPLPINTNKEIWMNIVGQGSNVGNNLNFKLAMNETNNAVATLTIDKASASGRYMGTIMYPIYI